MYEAVLNLTHQRISRFHRNTIGSLKALSIVATARLIINLAIKPIKSPIRNIVKTLKKDPVSRRNLTFSTIIQRTSTFTDFDKQLLLVEIEKLSRSTSRFGSENENAHVIIVESLSSCLTEEFDSSWLSALRPSHLLDSEKHYIKQILKALNGTAKNLRTLTIGDLLNTRCYNYEVDQTMMGCIEKMKFLSHLTFNDCCVDFFQLTKVCSGLHHLRFVSANILKIVGEIDLVKLQTNISSLKEFQFKALAGENALAVREAAFFLANLCLQHVANLEVIGEKAMDEEADASLYFDFQSGVTDWNKRLRHLLVQPVTTDEFKCYQKFPEVTHLKIDWNKFLVAEEFSQFPRFSQLLYAKILHLRSEKILYTMLMETGITLNALCLVQKHSNVLKISYNLIFKLCPNLETLEMRGGLVAIDSSEQIKCHAKLKNLILGDVRPELILSNIVTAPGLERLVIRNVILVSEDIENITNLVAKENILRRLSRLEINYFPIKDRDCSLALANFVEKISTFSPNLTYLKCTLH